MPLSTCTCSLILRRPRFSSQFSTSLQSLASKERDEKRWSLQLQSLPTPDRGCLAGPRPLRIHSGKRPIPDHRNLDFLVKQYQASLKARTKRAKEVRRELEQTRDLQVDQDGLEYWTRQIDTFSSERGRTLYISNLHPKTTSRQLALALGRFGHTTVEFEINGDLDALKTARAHFSSVDQSRFCWKTYGETSHQKLYLNDLPLQINFEPP